MSNHTPGPWNLYKNEPSWVHANKKIVATVRKDEPLYETWLANAHLIAAAPEGHDILSFIWDWLEQGGASISPDALVGDVSLRNAVNAYYEKATGKKAER